VRKTSVGGSVGSFFLAADWRRGAGSGVIGTGAIESERLDARDWRRSAVRAKDDRLSRNVSKFMIPLFR
jgi:hypothetical protein